MKHLAGTRHVALPDGALAVAYGGLESPASVRSVFLSILPRARGAAVHTVRMSDGEGMATAPALAADEEGNVLVVWGQRPWPRADPRLLARGFDRLGHPLGAIWRIDDRLGLEPGDGGARGR